MVAVMSARARLPMTLRQCESEMTLTAGQANLPDEADITDGKEADEDAAADDAGVSRVLPELQRGQLGGAAQHHPAVRAGGRHGLGRWAGHLTCPAPTGRTRSGLPVSRTLQQQLAFSGLPCPPLFWSCLADLAWFRT